MAHHLWFRVVTDQISFVHKFGKPDLTQCGMKEMAVIQTHTILTGFETKLSASKLEGNHFIYFSNLLKFLEEQRFVMNITIWLTCIFWVKLFRQKKANLLKLDKDGS